MNNLQIGSNCFKQVVYTIGLLTYHVSSHTWLAPPHFAKIELADKQFAYNCQLADLANSSTKARFALP